MGPDIRRGEHPDTSTGQAQRDSELLQMMVRIAAAVRGGDLGVDDPAPHAESPSVRRRCHRPHGCRTSPDENREMPGALAARPEMKGDQWSSHDVRAYLRGLRARRSPGSRIYFPPAFPPRRAVAVSGGSLPGDSCGTAPDLHRVPCAAVVKRSRRQPVMPGTPPAAECFNSRSVRSALYWVICPVHLGPSIRGVRGL